MYALKVILFIVFIVLSCTPNKSTKQTSDATKPQIELQCDSKGCRGVYNGPEFINGEDVAHQFSNKMAAAVGDKLKALYKKREYLKVDLTGIKMSTFGMDNRADVVYELSIPFKSVADSCQAYTSFDHRGGWGHKPNLETVLSEFRNKEKLEYIYLTTHEGLTEYWLQWQNENFQKPCKE
ncbi:MAG: hypothetical protein RLZZ337_1543 [Bacteroidota bacterium]